MKKRNYTHVQMLLSEIKAMLTDPDNPMKLCAHCGKAFIARRTSSRFCSAECRSKSKKEE